MNVRKKFNERVTNILKKIATNMISGIIVGVILTSVIYLSKPQLELDAQSTYSVPDYVILKDLDLIPSALIPSRLEKDYLFNVTLKIHNSGEAPAKEVTLQTEFITVYEVRDFISHEFSFIMEDNTPLANISRIFLVHDNKYSRLEENGILFLGLIESGKTYEIIYELSFQKINRLNRQKIIYIYDSNSKKLMGLPNDFIFRFIVEEKNYFYKFDFHLIPNFLPDE